MKKIINQMFMVTMMIIISASIVSCGGSSSDEPETPNADLTALTAKITECETVANAATTADYPETAISTFKTTIAAAKTAAASTSITQTQVDNLVKQLTEALATFQKAAYGAIDATACILNFPFDTQGDQTSTGTLPYVAKAMAGPSEVFGTNTALPTYVDGIKGKACHLTQGSHYEISSYASAALLPKDMSISVWVKPDKTKAGNYIISYNYWNNWKFQLQTENKPFYTFATSTGVADADNEAPECVKNGVWTHLVISLSLTNHTLAFYVNGELTKTWDATGKGPLAASAMAAAFTSTVNGTLPLLIGACTTYPEVASFSWTTLPIDPANWDSFEGAIDELKVYNIALSDGQVKKLYKDEK